MNTIAAIAARTAIESMFRAGHFSICTVDKVMKLTGSIAPRTTYDTLALLHCIDYKDMPPELIAQLPKMVAECISAPAIDIEAAFTIAKPALARGALLDGRREVNAKLTDGAKTGGSNV